MRISSWQEQLYAGSPVWVRMCVCGEIIYDLCVCGGEQSDDYAE